MEVNHLGAFANDPLTKEAAKHSGPERGPRGARPAQSGSASCPTEQVAYLAVLLRLSSLGADTLYLLLRWSETSDETKHSVQFQVNAEQMLATVVITWVL